MMREVNIHDVNIPSNAVCYIEQTRHEVVFARDELYNLRYLLFG